MDKQVPLTEKELPSPPALAKLLGPSFILLGLGLGSGELILWPYLVANFGLGIIWGALVGITFQFFMNMEIERYALVNGESIFVGYARRFGKIAPIWFLFSTLIPWMWPGIIASSSELIAVLFPFIGFQNHEYLAIIELLFIGVILTLGPTLYKTVEKFQKTLITIGVPLIFILVVLTLKDHSLADLSRGLLGKGNGYWFIAKSLPFASFLAAFAYTGAGGNLNLAQSYYIKEKGYGMGKYAGRITSIFTGKEEKISLQGVTFPTTVENIKKFNNWWRKINIEHAVVFWGTGLFTVLLLALLSYSNVYGLENSNTGIEFMVFEAQIIGRTLIPAAGTIFIIITAIFLFATQLTVFDATSRIMGENLILLSPRHFPTQKLRIYFYGFLWLQILLGCVAFLTGFSQPIVLLTISGVLNAIAMFVHTSLTLFINKTVLPKPLRPSATRAFAMLAALLFFGGFSIFTVTQIFK